MASKKTRVLMVRLPVEIADYYVNNGEVTLRELLEAIYYFIQKGRIVPKNGRLTVNRQAELEEYGFHELLASYKRYKYPDYIIKLSVNSLMKQLWQKGEYKPPKVIRQWR